MNIGYLFITIAGVNVVISLLNLLYTKETGWFVASLMAFCWLLAEIKILLP